MKYLSRCIPAGIVFVFAFFIRLLYNVTVARHYYPTHDAHFYQTIGFKALHAHCYCLNGFFPTVNRAPLWPMLIAFISIPFGPSDFYARLFLSVLGAFTCVLVYFFAKAISNNTFVGLAGGGIAALYPGLFIYDGWLYTESPTSSSFSPSVIACIAYSATHSDTNGSFAASCSACSHLPDQMGLPFLVYFLYGLFSWHDGKCFPGPSLLKVCSPVQS